ncbi:MAG TPA: metalloendopeptidase, partial [Bradyrhizobium sp.]|nr:metalloendopeptidase [Bradyrhizobium sp.]
MDSGPQNTSASSGASGFAIYFDGASSRRRLVTLEFNDRLEIREYEHTLAAWSYADVRLADSPSGTLRVTCLTAPELARLEIRDAAVAAELTARCAQLDENIPGRHGIARIVGWSLAATVSIVAVVLFGVPLAADRLTPLVPQAFERRLGDVAEGQVKTMFGGKICD